MDGCTEQVVISRSCTCALNSPPLHASMQFLRAWAAGKGLQLLRLYDLMVQRTPNQLAALAACMVQCLSACCSMLLEHEYLILSS